MKHEWRKQEKPIYFPGKSPETIDIPEFRFFAIEGEGNPNNDFFTEYVGVLYQLSYGVKMNLKKLGARVPKGYMDYTVYPLEGVWDIRKEAKKDFNGTINKEDLIFKLMIRQPDFINEAFAHEIVELNKKKKPHPLLDKVTFENITEGKCIQMLHLGSYDNEPESFRKMEAFASEKGLERVSKAHREIYLSDFRKVAPEKLKTVLRFQLSDN